MKQRIDESLTRLSEELADAIPRRGFLRRLGVFGAVFTFFGALERAFARGYDVADCLPVDGVTLTDGGTGYPDGSKPLVFSGGGGSGATGTATVAGGVITSVSLTAGGSGYTLAPTVSVAGGTGATITAHVTPCTHGLPCSNTGSECGNGGVKCRNVVKTSTDPKDPCCNCKEAKDDVCPPPLVQGGAWLACCLCTETQATIQTGTVYAYADCCQKAGLKYPEGCPEECYAPGNHHVCEGAERGGPNNVNCLRGSGSDWCNALPGDSGLVSNGVDNGKDLCTLPGSDTGKCCKWS